MGQILCYDAKKSRSNNSDSRRFENEPKAIFLSVERKAKTAGNDKIEGQETMLISRPEVFN